MKFMLSEDDIIYPYLLYLNHASYREAMIGIAWETIEYVQPTLEHYLLCGAGLESDEEVCALYLKMAKSYAIELSDFGSDEGLRISQEYRLSNLGYSFPEKSMETLVSEYEFACVSLIAKRLRGDDRTQNMLEVYKARSADYANFLREFEVLALVLCGHTQLERSFRDLERFIAGYAYGGVTEVNLREVENILESLL